jgi:hypothetical protein
LAKPLGELEHLQLYDADRLGIAMNQQAHLFGRFAAEGHLATLITNLDRNVVYKDSTAVNFKNL